jgi:hypothetical protein
LQLLEEVTGEALAPTKDGCGEDLAASSPSRGLRVRRRRPRALRQATLVGGALPPPWSCGRRCGGGRVQVVSVSVGFLRAGSVFRSPLRHISLLPSDMVLGGRWSLDPLKMSRTRQGGKERVPAQ